MAKQKDNTLSARGLNTVTQLSKALADAGDPMFVGTLMLTGKTTRAQRKQVALNNLCRAKQQMRHTLRKVRASGW